MKKILFATLLIMSGSVMAQNNPPREDPNNPFKSDPSYVHNDQANGGSLTETIQTKTVYPDGTTVTDEKKIKEEAHDGTEGR
jgi:hypothetical protein